MECNTPMMAYVNPLALLEVDEPWASLIKSDLTLEVVLRYLTSPDLESNLESIVQRYKQISIENPRISISPDNRNILKKIIWPLKQAKGSYILGNYIGTISLCGFVSEMIALMVFDITDKKVNNHDLDKVLQRELFGSEFEKLGQDRRIEILKVYGIISKETYELYKEIKNIRRKYIHFWSSKLEGIEKDSIKCFVNTVKIVIDGLGLSIENGQVKLRDELLRMLEKTAT